MVYVIEIPYNRRSIRDEEYSKYTIGGRNVTKSQVIKGITSLDNSLY